jgi:Asp/Glu/hydantoin racemase
MVTCSSIGAGVRVAQEVFDFPVLRVDDAMAEEAVRLGSTIGVLATLRTTLEPTVNLLRETAAAQARDIKIVRRLCDGAFDAVISGDNETHDDIVLAELARLTEQVEVVVLAQASMARVVACIPPEARKIPILSSPEFAVRHARAVLCPSGQAA